MPPESVCSQSPDSTPILSSCAKLSDGPLPGLLITFSVTLFGHLRDGNAVGLGRGGRASNG